MAQINLALPRFPERAIRYSDARKILLKNMSAECDLATCFIGPPGIGKTALVEEVAQEIKAHLCVIPLSCYDASELKGIPRVVSLDDMRKMHPSRVKENTSGYVTYYAHNFEFPATDDPDLWIFFFDEFNTVSPSTQVPIFQATQKRCITGSYQFPKNNRIVLAGNRPKDSEAVQPIPSPIISRVNLHEIVYDNKEWLAWGKHIHGGIRAFISNNPERLCYFTDEMVKQVQPYATPRTWDYANTVLHAYLEQSLAELKPNTDMWRILEHHLCGSVGYDAVTFRDSNNKNILNYIQEEAARGLDDNKPTTAKVRRMVQSFEEDKKNARTDMGEDQTRETRASILAILQALPEIEPSHAAVFFKRMQAFSSHVIPTLVSHRELGAAINRINGLKENLATLK